MKKTIQLTITFLLSLALIACGGGDKVADNGSVITPTTHDAGKLIIDNGRGTVNNQDTER